MTIFFLEVVNTMKSHFHENTVKFENNKCLEFFLDKLETRIDNIGNYFRKLYTELEYF